MSTGHDHDHGAQAAEVHVQVVFHVDRDKLRQLVPGLTARPLLQSTTLHAAAADAEPLPVLIGCMIEAWAEGNGAVALTMLDAAALFLADQAATYENRSAP